MKKGYIQKNEKGQFYCPKCNSYKDKKSFQKQKNNKHRNGLRQICKDCRSRLIKENRKIGEDLEFCLKELLLRSQNRKERKHISLEFLKELYNKQKGNCAISGLPLTYIIGKGKIMTNISIDRIDNDRRYDLDNIQLVQRRVNEIKSNMTIEELLFYCKNIIKNYE